MSRRGPYQPRGSSTQIWELPADTTFADGAWTTLPTASADFRGTRLRTEGATGVADKNLITAKMANDSYTNGVVPVHGTDILFIRNAVAKTLTNGTGAQSPFTAANDTLTVEAATLYKFEALIATVQGTTSHTVAWTFAGTATLTNIGYYSEHVSVTDTTLASNDIDNKWTIVGTAVVITPAITATGSIIRLQGTFLTNAAGTLIPQITFSADPTGTCECQIGSYFHAWKLPSAAVGPWA